ncbi:hypothetical protein ACFQY7_36075 [Actinomadura luteofluorescens]|uniref:Uncharacterized protein n=1 Tax=Actinomadura luteofluorescens TaxID=46163 RepID=A0A7Y9EJL9_9ACTN|nr:hypothetical protein [Actinomadura luteofluorescens]NYD48852.1 hypothetical protein [Actinomadura luteofluorescens]
MAIQVAAALPRRLEIRDGQIRTDSGVPAAPTCSTVSPGNTLVVTVRPTAELSVRRE